MKKHFNLRSLALATSMVFLVGCQSPEEKVQGFVEKAIVYLEAGDFDSAQIEFSNALQINPNHIQGLYRVTEVFERDQDWLKVRAYLDRIIELDPNHVAALRKLAMLDLAGGDLENAVLNLERVERFAPEAPDTLALRGLVSLRQEDLERARQSAEAALAQNPEHTHAGLVMASLALQEGNVEGAIDIAEALSNQDDGAVQIFRMNVLNSTGDVTRIAEYYRELLAQRPGDEQLYRGLASVYAQFGLPEEGRAVLLEGLAALSDSEELESVYWGYLGRYLGVEVLIDALDEALAVDPQRVDLKLQKATSLAQAQGARVSVDEEITDILRSIVADAPQSDEAASALAALASAAYQSGELDEGDALVLQLLELDAGNPEGLRLQAQRLVDQGDLQSGLNQLRTLQANNPDSAPIATAIGRAQRSAGRIDLAIDQFRRAIALTPSDQRLAIEFSSLLVAQGQLAEADSVLTEASRAQLNPRLLSLLLEVKLQVQDWNGALRISETLARFDEFQQQAELGRGVALMGLNRVDEGLALLQNAYFNAESKQQPLVTLVRSYLRWGRGQQAVAFLDQRLVETPNDAFLTLLRAQSLRAINELDAAEVAFQDYLKLEPDNVSAYSQLASLHIGQNERPRALEAIGNGLDRDPENTELLFKRATLETLNGDEKAAIASLSAILEVNPEALPAANNLALLLAEAGPSQDLERALELAQPLKRTQVAAFLDTVGWVSLKAENYRDAVYFLEQAARLAPDSGEIRYHLAQAYWATEQTAAAQAELRLALNDPDFAQGDRAEMAKTQLASGQ